jgi:hypothetical protein
VYAVIKTESAMHKVLPTNNEAWGFSEANVRDALHRLDPLWDELFPAEQARIVQLLVERVDISTEGADIRLRTQGLTSLVADLSAIQPEARRAA